MRGWAWFMFLRAALAHPSACLASNGQALLQSARVTLETRLEGSDVAFSPYDFELEAEPNHATWVYMHIAKTGGSSWVQNMRSDILPIFLQGDGFLSGENCSHELAQAVRTQTNTHFSVMLREPRAEIYSLYMMDCCSEWGKAVRKYTVPHPENVTAWLTWFSQLHGTENFGTYHPLNFQARHFICLDNAHEVLLPEPSISSVLANFSQDFEFVGILERYQESICLFISIASGKLPAYCNCDDPESWRTFPEVEESYEVPPHDISDLSSDDIRMIDELTKQDAVLYAAGVQRFIQDIDLAEQKHGVRILCDREIM